MEPPFKYLPNLPEYHPNSELRVKPGCYPNVSIDQLSKVSDLKNLIDEKGIDINIDDELEFLKLLRFLRAKKFDVEKAFDYVVADTEWRFNCDVLRLRRQHVVDTIDCSLEEIYKCLPTWVQGHDKQLRPVSYQQVGKFEIVQALKLTSMENLIKFHVWQQEQTLRMMYERSKRCGYNIETFVVVLDAEGFSLRLGTGDAYLLMKALISLDSSHYPERLGTLVVINAPSVLWITWRIIQSFLDDVTRAKIKILSDQSEWQPVLQSLISVDQIPKKYGGLAPNLSPEEALFSMNPGDDIPRHIPECESSPLKSLSGKATATIREQKPAEEISNPFGFWISLFQCSGPNCTSGGQDFDFEISSTERTPKKGDDETDSETDGSGHTAPLEALDSDVGSVFQNRTSSNSIGQSIGDYSETATADTKAAEGVKSYGMRGNCIPSAGCHACVIC